MPLVSFDDLPDQARLWVFAASRALDSAEATELLGQMDPYLDSWKAHGAPLRVGRDLRHNRFFLVAVDESAAGASGCSIDGLVRCVRDAEQTLGITLTDNAPVWFKDVDGFRRVTRDEFRNLASTGAVNLDTTVFDATISSLGAARQGRLEVPARDAWHGRAFFGHRVASNRGA